MEIKDQCSDITTLKRNMYLFNSAEDALSNFLAFQVGVSLQLSRLGHQLMNDPL
jgi:hypothetical protein